MTYNYIYRRSVRKNKIFVCSDMERNKKSNEAVRKSREKKKKQLEEKTREKADLK